MTFIYCLLSAFTAGAIVSWIYDHQVHRHRKAIAILQVELAKADFELNLAQSVREQFDKESV